MKLFLFSFIALISTSYGASKLVNLKTTEGLVLGEQVENYQYFQSIPYASPPIKNLRWKAPRSPQKRSKIWDGRGLTPRCVQRENFFSGTSQKDFDKIVGSEDCLYLNIWKPINSKNKKPAFFWIHGGSNFKGYALDEAYSGKNIVNKLDAVIITVNYRLGIFGALKNSKFFPGKNLEDNSGNYVTLDLISALNWVRKNADSLNIDLNKITIAGESAGCMNVWGLIQSPLAKNLFQRAFCSSGFPNNYPDPVANNFSTEFIQNSLLLKGLVKDQNEAQYLFQKWNSKEIKEYLYNLSSEEIVKSAPKSIPIQHISDGYVFPRLGLASLLHGGINQVPIMMGNNKNEGSLFIAQKFLGITKNHLWNIVNEKESSVIIQEFLNDPEFQKFSSNDKDVSITIEMILDLISNMTQVYLPNIYRYQIGFTANTEPWTSFFGAAHGIDIPLVFQIKEIKNDHFFKFLSPDLSSNQTSKIQNIFGTYLKNFIHTGSPNQKKFPKWKPWKNWRLAPYNLVITNESVSTERIFPSISAPLNSLRLIPFLMDHYKLRTHAITGE